MSYARYADLYKPKPVNQSNTTPYQSNILPGLLVLFSTTCPHCTTLMPKIDELSKHIRINIKKLQVNSSDAKVREILEKLPFEIEGVPTLALYRNGQYVKKTEGDMPLQSIIQFVQS
jgi:thiol-disulfide isomerase/thioredoxin